MQGAKVSKTMLPCWRRVHLHKSASFKTIFENIQANHTNDAKIDSRMIEQSITKTIEKMMPKNINK